MAAPTITALPTAPDREDAPKVFAQRADAFVAALATFVTELNAFGTYLDSIGLGATAATAAEIWTGTEAAKYISPDKLFDAAAFQTLTDAATIAIDMGAGLNFKVTLGGNRTLANPTDAKEGQSGVIRVIQDATGSRTLSYGDKWLFPGGASANALSTAASAVDLIAYVVGDDGNVYATLSKAFSA